jgi:hypothetical protein
MNCLPGLASQVASQVARVTDDLNKCLLMFISFKDAN